MRRDPGARPPHRTAVRLQRLTAAPALHGTTVLSGTYRLTGLGPQAVTLPLGEGGADRGRGAGGHRRRTGGPWGYTPVTVAWSGRAVTSPRQAARW